MLLKIASKVSRTAELIAAITLAAIFVTFLLQIFTRYAPKIAWLMPLASIEAWMLSLVPIGWTVNLISLLWVWLIFLGCSFFVRDKDHVIFDVFYSALSGRWRKILAMATCLLLVAVMVYAIGPTYDAIFGSMLMNLKKIQTLRMPITGDKIPIKWLFAPVVMFMALTILRYGFRFFSLLKMGIAGESDSLASAGESHRKGENS
ncbi:MAG: TRAP transporter small permease subunit [Alphaproteobacteria bacterium]|nr:TRAP transporter small permease subunit [Alphaproteobacteria bacterium]